MIRFIKSKSVDWGQLSELSTDWKKYEDGVTAKKIYKDEKTIVLLSKMPQGVEVKKHSHPNIDEIFIVLDGAVEDTVGMFTMLGVNYQYIPEGIPHSHHAQKKSLVVVVWKKID